MSALELSSLNLIVGGSWGDALDGGAHSDRIVGGSGDDTLDGGAGVDLVLGGSGSDHLIFRAWQNRGDAAEAEVYDGGTGAPRLGTGETPDADLLTIYLSEEQLDSASFMEAFLHDIACYESFIREHTDPLTSQAGQAQFSFSSINLKVSAIENVRWGLDPTLPNVNDAPTGAVLISGDAVEGATLTASNTLGDEDGMGVVAYQWLRDGVAIEGATGDTYVLSQDDVGAKITAAASYTDQQGTEESVTSDPTDEVANVNDAPTGSVVISGDAVEGATLTASNTLDDEDGMGVVTYQWLRNGVAIEGATGDTYELSQDDVGAAISVAASYADQQGNDESVTSDPTDEVANIVPLAGGGFASVDEDATITGWLTGSDVEGTVLSFALVKAVEGLSLGADGSYSYAPPADFSGEVTFEYVVRDGRDVSAPASFTIRVNPVKDEAVIGGLAQVDLIETDSAADISTSGQLTVSDADGADEEHFVEQAGVAGQYGTFSIDRDGAWTYAANSAHNAFRPGQTYTEQFAVTSADGTSQIVAVNIRGMGEVLNGTAAGDVLKAEDNDNPYQINGFDGDDILIGGKIADELNGGAGNDEMEGRLGGDQMKGAGGNDIYFVDNANDVVVELANEGTDEVRTLLAQHVLGDNQENLTGLSATGQELTGNTLGNRIRGGGGADVIWGKGGDDTLDGRGGTDLIYGGGGNDFLKGTDEDMLVGGEGDDTYLVYQLTVKIVETSGQGTDLIQSYVSYTLADHFEKLNLMGTEAINGTGNSVANDLDGNTANNVLDGSGGVDTLTGGAGDDTYIVDDAADRIIEYSAQGDDLVLSSVSYTLSLAVERLTLTGSNSVQAFGNAAANILIGNSGDNLIDGGQGADNMSGGGGDDTYVISEALDQVSEVAAAGTDLVQSGISYVLSLNVENLTLTGSSAVNGTGNTLGNKLIGNAASNVLNGGAGADTLLGEGGNDTYIVDTAGDIVVETSATGGTDVVQSEVAYTLGSNVENLTLIGTRSVAGTGNSLANNISGNGASNILTGGAGNDVISGGAGFDKLIGGEGNDTLTGGGGTDVFYFEAPLGAVNADRILDFAAVDDSIFLKRAVFTGIASIGTLSSAAFHTGTVADDAADRIVYDQTTGRIFYDADGNGGVAAVLFATVTAGTVLTHADFSGY